MVMAHNPPKKAYLIRSRKAQIKAFYANYTVDALLLIVKSVQYVQLNLSCFTKNNSNWTDVSLYLFNLLYMNYFTVQPMQLMLTLINFDGTFVFAFNTILSLYWVTT